MCFFHCFLMWIKHFLLSLFQGASSLYTLQHTHLSPQETATFLLPFTTFGPGDTIFSFREKHSKSEIKSRSVSLPLVSTGTDSCYSTEVVTFRGRSFFVGNMTGCFHSESEEEEMRTTLKIYPGLFDGGIQWEEEDVINNCEFGRRYQILLGDSLALTTLILLIDSPQMQKHPPTANFDEIYQKLLAHLKPEGYFTFAARGT